MTEDEAKTKICCGPLLPVHVEIKAGIFREDGSVQIGRCIGSQCMAWRWEAKFGVDPNNPANATKLPPTDGFCGLAGRPE